MTMRWMTAPCSCGSNFAANAICRASSFTYRPPGARKRTLSFAVLCRTSRLPNCWSISHRCLIHSVHASPLQLLSELPPGRFESIPINDESTEVTYNRCANLPHQVRGEDETTVQSHDHIQPPAFALARNFPAQRGDTYGDARRGISRSFSRAQSCSSAITIPDRVLSSAANSAAT